MDMRKILLAFLFICLFTYISAESITNLKIPTTIYTGEFLKVSGTTTTPNIWCSFIIYDDNGFLADRATDELSNIQGDFVSNMLQINQPPFFMGSDYNVVVNCGEAQDSSIFTAQNKRDVSFFAFTAFDWWLLPKNRETFFIFGIGAIFVTIIVLGIYFAWKLIRSK